MNRLTLATRVFILLCMSTHRNPKSGRYDDSKLEKLCACGHTLGVHLAGGDRGCINHEVGDGTECECAKFKKARK